MSAGGILSVDETSALVHAAAGATLSSLEGALASRGMWLGAIPVESRGRTLGAALASPRPSEATPGGRLVDRCAALDAVLPDGMPISTRLAPRRATGPDYSAALIGARGSTGRITAAWMRARRRAPITAFAGFVVTEGAAALHGARALLAAGLLPTDLTLLDVPLAAQAAAGVSEALRGAPEGAAVVLLRFDGNRDTVQAEERRTAEVMRWAGARTLAARLVEDLLLRRAPLRLLERFVPVEVLAGAWSGRRAPAALLGLRHSGAAYCTAASADLPVVEPPDPAVGALHAALQQALVPPVGLPPPGDNVTALPFPAPPREDG